MSRLTLLSLLSLFVSAPAFAADEPAAFAVPVVADEALSEMRGGFALPGGLDIAVAVQSDTRVNGVLLLRSVFVVDKGPAALTVYGRTDGAPAISMSAAGGAGSTTSVTFSNNAAAIGGATEGLQQLSFNADGSPVAASGGSVRVEQTGAQNQVILSQPTLDVSHLAGQTYGSIVANRGNDVSIDTVTNINVDLRNATAFNIGSSAFRVESLAFDAAMRLGR